MCEREREEREREREREKRGKKKRLGRKVLVNMCSRIHGKLLLSKRKLLQNSL